MVKKPSYIVLDGIDGSGKTSVLQRLMEVFPSGELEGSFLYTREPGGTRSSEMIRSVLLDAPVGPLAELLLFAAARIVVRNQFVAPALATGTHVISDRSDSSTFAYQLSGRQAQDLEELFFALRDMSPPLPDLYIFLDLPPEVASQRRSGRQSDHFDSESIEFFTRVRSGYREFAERTGAKCIFVDVCKSPEEVADEVVSIVRAHIN